MVTWSYDHDLTGLFRVFVGFACSDNAAEHMLTS